MMMQKAMLDKYGENAYFAKKTEHHECDVFYGDFFFC